MSIKIVIIRVDYNIMFYTYNELALSRYVLHALAKIVNYYYCFFFLFTHQR